jgi:hypothetical protein
MGIGSELIDQVPSVEAVGLPELFAEPSGYTTGVPGAFRCRDGRTEAHEHQARPSERR